MNNKAMAAGRGPSDCRAYMYQRTLEGSTGYFKKPSAGPARDEPNPQFAERQSNDQRIGLTGQ